VVKKYLKIALIIVLIANLSGCAELRRKLIKKKKSRKEEISFYRVEEYKTKPLAERYDEHYMLWHNWHLDLLRMEGTSHLRDLRAANEVLRHLTEMRDLLEQEKASELNVQIEQMEGVIAKLKREKRDVAEDVRSRRLLEKIERIIINDFTYNRIKGYIKESE
jgi:hypothetical protein